MLVRNHGMGPIMWIARSHDHSSIFTVSASPRSTRPLGTGSDPAWLYAPSSHASRSTPVPIAGDPDAACRLGVLMSTKRGVVERRSPRSRLPADTPRAWSMRRGSGSSALSMPPFAKYRPTARYVDVGTGMDDATLTRGRLAAPVQPTNVTRREKLSLSATDPARTCAAEVDRVAVPRQPRGRERENTIGGAKHMNSRRLERDANTSRVTSNAALPVRNVWIHLVRSCRIFTLRVRRRDFATPAKPSGSLDNLASSMPAKLHRHLLASTGQRH